MEIKVIIGFDNYKDIKLIVSGRYITHRMTDNANFPSPYLAINEIDTAVKEFAAIELVCRENSTKEFTKEKKKKRKTLIGLLKKLGKYVELNCDNDHGKVISSGYKVRKKAVRRKKLLEKIQKINLKSKPKASSTMLAKVDKKILRAKGYLFMYTQMDGDGFWKYLPSTKMGIEIPELIPGRKLRVKCAATGTPKKLVWSEEFSLFAQ